jgi:hypothetical protein
LPDYFGLASGSVSQPLKPSKLVLDGKGHSIFWFAMLQRIARFASQYANAFFQFVSKGRVVWIALIAVFALSGCVNYEVGLNFDSPTRGAIVQHIRLDERLTSVSSGTAQAWLNNIEQRARQVQGKTRRLSGKEISVTIPFTTGQELEKKFNTFFNPKAKVRGKRVDVPPIESHLKVEQGNFLLLERRKVIYDVDLRSLGVTSASGEVLVDPSSLINLQFGLTTPWGARNVVRPGSVASRRVGKQLVWILQPGQKNHLEAAFWMPSPLGIGTLVIIGIVAGGLYLKNQQSPANGEPTDTSGDKPAVEPSGASSS